MGWPFLPSTFLPLRKLRFTLRRNFVKAFSLSLVPSLSFSMGFQPVGGYILMAQSSSLSFWLFFGSVSLTFFLTLVVYFLFSYVRRLPVETRVNLGLPDKFERIFTLAENRPFRLSPVYYYFIPNQFDSTVSFKMQFEKQVFSRTCGLHVSASILQ